MSQTPSSRSWQSSVSQPHATGASMEQLPSASQTPSPASVVQLAPHGWPLHGDASAPPLAELDELLARLDWSEPFPASELGAPRGRQGSPRDKVALPERWLDDTDGTGYGLTEETNETTGG